MRRARNRQVAEKTAGLHHELQAISDALRRQLRRQSVARQQRRRADQHSGKIAGRGGQGGHIAADGCGGLRRAHHVAGLRLHEHAGLRSGFADRPGGGRLQPDRVHHRTRQRHRIPFDPGDQDRQQQRTPTGACTTTWISMPARSPTASRAFRRWAGRSSTCCCAWLRANDLRRAAGAQGIRAVAHRAGAVGIREAAHVSQYCANQGSRPTKSRTMAAHVSICRVTVLMAARCGRRTRPPVKKSAFDKATSKLTCATCSSGGRRSRSQIADPKPSPLPGFARSRCTPRPEMPAPTRRCTSPRTGRRSCRAMSSTSTRIHSSRSSTS